MNGTVEYKHTLAEVEKRMADIADEHGIELVHIEPDEGDGGYNYGISTGGIIWLAPFKKGKAGETFGKYTLPRSCDNPVECLFISFFHELSHCRLSKNVPMRVKGYEWNGTSDYQYELWITMLGLEYARRKYGIVFSDQSVRWLLDENSSRINDDWTDVGADLVQKEPAPESYSVVGWEGPAESESFPLDSAAGTSYTSPCKENPS